MRSFRGFCLGGDEGEEGLVVLASTLGGWGPYGGTGDEGRRGGTPYLGHGLRRPNFVPKFGASVRVVVFCGGRVMP